MSTAFMTDEQLTNVAAAQGLEVTLVPSRGLTFNPEADDYRITHWGEMVFQGARERCSDFLKGWQSGVILYKKHHAERL